MEHVVIAKNPTSYGWGKKRLRITGRRTYDLVLKQGVVNDDSITLNSCSLTRDEDGFECLVLDVDGVDANGYVWTVNGNKVEGITGNALPIYVGYETLEITCSVENESFLMVLTGKADECGTFNYNVHNGLTCGGQLICGNKLRSDVPLPVSGGSE